MDELNKLTKPSLGVLFSVFIHYLIVFVLWALYSYFYHHYPWALIFLVPPFFMMIGWLQFSLSNGLHEGIHDNFGPPFIQKLTYLLCGYPIGFHRGYKDIHLNHHRYFGQGEKDPDYFAYTPFPKNKREFKIKMLVNLSGFSAIKQFSRQIKSKEKKESSSSLIYLFKIACVQLFLLTMATLFFHWSAYFILWLAPLPTVGKFLGGLRTFCEHGNPFGDPVIRTITGHWWQTKTLGTFCFHFHAEHHDTPRIPFHNLEKSHHLLADKLMDKNKNLTHYQNANFEGGYLNLLAYWYASLPER